jgi:single-stranded DNA-binding protein
MSTSSPASKTTLTLYGVLKSDPVERTARTRTTIERVPDRSVEQGYVEKKVTTPGRPYWKLSLGVERGGRTEWYDCVIWNPEKRPAVQSADRARQGDRVLLTGYLERYSFKGRDGKTVSGTHFVVESFELVG